MSRADRLALALWWLIESAADEFEMPPERAADEVAMLCELAREMMPMGGDGARLRDDSAIAAMGHLNCSQQRILLRNRISDHRPTSGDLVPNLGNELIH